MQQHVFGIINALDEGSFLWAQKTVQNFTNNEKSIITPGRWTRSIFNWLHSPLINSIQEAFVIDSVYENLVPVTKCLKRCIPNKISDLNVEERFENEFFLWEDNKGSPLEFGLKQIQEIKPNYQQLSHENVVHHSNNVRSNSFWEEPLLYEDNQDVKDIDINNLSYHEQLKLNDILKNKMHSALTHIFPHRFTTKNHSLYYTLPPDLTKSTTTTWPKLDKDNFLKQRKTGFLRNSKKYDMNSEPNRYRETGSIKDINFFSALNTINISNISKHKLKNRSFHDYNAYIKSTTTKTNMITSTSTFQQYLKTIISKSRNPTIAKDLFSFLDEISYNKNPKPLKHINIRKYYLKEGTNHRDLRTVHHGRFPKHRRIGKWKHILKNPEGRSYQYELFSSGSIKSSP